MPALMPTNPFLILLLLLLAVKVNSQQSYTFTNCGATGSVGPTQTQINTAYATTNLNGMVTSISGVQQWTVPSTGLYRVSAWGASGGDATSYTTSPGNGAIIEGDFNFNAGDIVRVLVGQMGQSRTTSGGGGGGSFVTRAPHNTTTAIVVVAGGGGAASQDFSGISATTTPCGTFDQQSGPAQCAGDGGLSFTGNSGSGGGGFFNNGQGGGIGAGGVSYVNGGTGGGTNNQQQGGFGGGGGQNGTGTYAGCGGGGFSGGNGGNRNSTVGTGRMGGGGGGSFNNGTNQLNSINTTTGHGRVVITELCNLTLSNTATGSGNASICSGTSLTLTTNAISNYSWSTGSTAASVVISPTATTVYSLSGTTALACTASAQMTVFVSQGMPTVSIVQTTNSICQGQAVTFTASGATTYTWVSGAWGGTLTNAVPFSPSVTSNYTVSGQNACGVSSATTNVTIAPLAVFAVSSASALCAGSPGTLTAASAATSYTWLPGNFVSNTPSLVVSPVQNTTYTIAASDGTCSGAATLAIVANPVPTIVAVASSTQVCQGAIVTLSASGGVSYTWTPGNLSGPTITVNPLSPTAYNVTGDNTFGCQSGASAVIITIPSPSLNLTASDVVVCSGQSVSLNASGASTYTWSTASNNSIITVSPGTTTTYSVTGTTNGCDDSQSITIAVVNPSVTITGPSAVCVGKEAQFAASGASSYTWFPGAFVQANVSYTPTAASVYTVLSTTSQSNINCSASNTVQVGILPEPQLTATPDRSVACRNETITISASGATTYTWSGVQGSGGSALVSSSLVTTIVYGVSGTGANGCIGQTSGNVVINACNALSEQHQNSSIRLFPNPGNGEFFIAAEGSGQVQVFNQIGQLVKYTTLSESADKLTRIDGLPVGIYQVVVFQQDVKRSFKVVLTN